MQVSILYVILINYKYFFQTNIFYSTIVHNMLYQIIKIGRGILTTVLKIKLHSSKAIVDKYLIIRHKEKA